MAGRREREYMEILVYFGKNKIIPTYTEEELNLEKEMIKKRFFLPFFFLKRTNTHTHTQSMHENE
jgi:hypothetical protein